MPGKFDCDMDRALYDLTMSGVDEECGDVSSIGWWSGLMRDGADLEGHVIKLKISNNYDIPVDELRELHDCAGVIVTEDEQGFVKTAFFDTKAALDKEWSACESDAASAYEEEERDAASYGEDDGYDSDYADE